MSFTLNPRLEADTLFVKAGPLSDFRLMNDQRFCWLVLIPRLEGELEFSDLVQSDRALLSEEIVCADKAIRSVAEISRTNIGMLGNLVPQLHAHVVGRSPGDAAWPGPVWGVGTPEPFDKIVAQERINALADALP